MKFKHHINEEATLAKIQRLCGTCQYWVGPRMIDPTRNWVLFYNNEADGNCGHPKMNRFIRWKATLSVCQFWTKWSALN